MRLQTFFFPTSSGWIRCLFYSSRADFLAVCHALLLNFSYPCCQIAVSDLYNRRLQYFQAIFLYYLFPSLFSFLGFLSRFLHPLTFAKDCLGLYRSFCRFSHLLMPLLRFGARLVRFFAFCARFVSLFHRSASIARGLFNHLRRPNRSFFFALAIFHCFSLLSPPLRAMTRLPMHSLYPFSPRLSVLPWYAYIFTRLLIDSLPAPYNIPVGRFALFFSAQLLLIHQSGLSAFYHTTCTHASERLVRLLSHSLYASF